MKSLCITCIVFLLSYSFLVAQTVSTVTDGIFVDGMGMDSNQIIYCSNYFGDQVYSYNLQTEEVVEFANGLTTPNGIGVTPDDKIYVSEATANRITVFNTAGNQIEQIIGLNNPTGIKYDFENQRFLLVSYNGNSLLSLDPITNNTEVLVSGPPFNGPSGIAFINGETYLSNFNDRKIFRLTVANQLQEIAQLPAGGTGTPPRNFCGFLTSKGNFLYATQQGEHRVYKIDPVSGETSVFSGSVLGNSDGSLENATYNRPNGILGDDTNDRIYVSEIGSGNLRVISDVSLGLDPIESNDDILMYPVPVDNILYLKSKFNTIDFATVYDMNGKEVLKHQSKHQERECIDVSGLSKGSYIIQITRNGRAFSSYKFIKR